MDSDLSTLLQQVADGEISVEQGCAQLQGAREKDIGYAKIDLHRRQRCGLPEVVFAPGKTPDQLMGIIETLAGAGQNVLATRASPEQYARVRAAWPQSVYHETARMISLQTTPPPPPNGLVVVACAGTSDLPVAEEAALTSEWMGARTERIYDVGVAGLHRLLRHLDRLRQARAVVVVAGMEGALPSVIGGLIPRPIIAVPTSIGYGSGLNGLAALLAMLNTCVPGISVVNIDNGFGAGVAAALINRTGT